MSDDADLMLDIENEARNHAEQRAHIQLLLERADLSAKDLSYAFDRVIKILEYALK
jgi:hypothetical protein